MIIDDLVRAFARAFGFSRLVQKYNYSHFLIFVDFTNLFNLLFNEVYIDVHFIMDLAITTLAKFGRVCWLALFTWFRDSM